MTPDDITLLLRFRGGHGMARVASRPDVEIPHWKQSLQGSYSSGKRIETKADGIHVTEAGEHRVIPWKAIKAHALTHTTDDVRNLIAAMDEEWCRASTGTPGHPPGRAVTCKRWLDGLARIVWDPALVRTEPEQLDLLNLLESP